MPDWYKLEILKTSVTSEFEYLLSLLPNKAYCDKFDSHLIDDYALCYGNLRLLEVDERLVLPVRTKLRLFITSTDVLHSWAIPSLGVKLDACPGRLNQTSLYIFREGVYYGQCSEIC